MRNTKLQQPPRGRQRVREVARDVELPVSGLLEMLSEIGEFVKSGASFIETPVIRRVHALCGIEYSGGDLSSRPMETTDNVPARPSLGLAPPGKRRRRDNHPLMGDVSPRRDFDSDEATHATGSQVPAWRNRTIQQQWADLSVGDASHAFEFEEWKLRGFSDVERDVWLSAGLRAGQARWAAELRDAGLSPSDLSFTLHGWPVVERLQRGEGARAVARMFRAVRDSAAG